MPLRCAWAVHPSHCLCAGETLPMWKPTTGEPYAGEPHVRFGGRGGATPLPDPYRDKIGFSSEALSKFMGHARKLEKYTTMSSFWEQSTGFATGLASTSDCH